MLLLPFWGRRTTKGWRGPWPGEISPGRPPSRLRRTPPRGGRESTGASPPPLGEGDPEGVEGAMAGRDLARSAPLPASPCSPHANGERVERGRRRRLTSPRFGGPSSHRENPG